MEIDLAAAARNRSDEELLAMLERDHHDYTAEALDAARAELRSRGVGWAEPVEPAPKNGVARPSGPAASTWTGLGAILLGIAMVSLLWRGVSLPGLALLIPGAALLLRSMKR